jgi:hypothetical protein
MPAQNFKQRQPNAPQLSTFALIFAAFASASLAQDAGRAIDWSDLDQATSEAARKADDPRAAFKISECPVERFEEAYGGTIDAANVHAASAIQLEVLRICTKRQDLADQLQKNNQRLREEINIEAVRDEELQAFLAWRDMSDEERRAALATTEPVPSPTIPNPSAPQTPSSSFSNTNPIAEEENSAASDEATQNPTPATDPTDAAAIAASTAPDPSINPTQSTYPEPATDHRGCAPEYLVDLAGHQRGGDGQYIWATLRGPLGQRFVVRAGDQLPGGVKIKSVSREVVLVTNKTGAIQQLAKAPEAAHEPNDASFLFTLTKQDQAVSSEFVMPTLEDLDK